MSDRELAKALFDESSRTFPVRLWDGTVLPPRAGPPASGAVVLRSPEAARLLLPPAEELALAEAFIAGDVELEGNLIDALEAVAHWRGPKPSLHLVRAFASTWARLLLTNPGKLRVRLRGREHSLERDRAAVQSHYDLSDAFYALFLDREMVYSCALFPRGEETLEEAQQAKLELVCRKLDLQPRDHLLDVGCGWGALVAHAAERYGCAARGITLSRNQFETAARRRTRTARGALIEISNVDYRELEGEGAFDKIASVGMMEHVGRAALAEYFGKLYALLRPGGLLLNHAIADIDRRNQAMRWMGRGSGGFIQRYIFPDSDLVPIGLVVQAAEAAGFEVRDLECLREHYAETLERWLERLEARQAEAEKLVGRLRVRAFRLYLASSAVAFRIGRIGLYQLLLAKRSERGRSPGLPRTRLPWCAPVEAAPGRERGISVASSSAR